MTKKKVLILTLILLLAFTTIGYCSDIGDDPTPTIAPTTTTTTVYTADAAQAVTPIDIDEPFKAE